MNGRLGAYDLKARTPQSVYYCAKDNFAAVAVNITNRAYTKTKIRLAVNNTQHSPNEADWIEFDTELEGKAVLERTGVLVGSNQYLTVYAENDMVNVVVWGSEQGNDTASQTISDNAIITTDSNTIEPVFTDVPYSYTLEATDRGTNTFAVVSGTLPTGLTLNTGTGEISGTATSGTYSGAGTQVTTQMTFSVNNSQDVNTPTQRTINILQKWADGSSPECAAPSGYHLAQNFTGFTNGEYWIKSASMPQALPMYVDFAREGGGYDFYLIRNDDELGPFAKRVIDPHKGNALGLDIVYPRSQLHWRAMNDAVVALDAENHQKYFQTTYGVHKTSDGGNYTGTIMRNAASYGTGSSDHRVGDDGRWWLRDSTFGEPNGDYIAYAFYGLVGGGYNFGGGAATNPYTGGDIGFNDGSASYALGTHYLLSTNAKP